MASGRYGYGTRFANQSSSHPLGRRFKAFHRQRFRRPVEHQLAVLVAGKLNADARSAVLDETAAESVGDTDVQMHEAVESPAGPEGCKKTDRELSVDRRHERTADRSDSRALREAKKLLTQSAREAGPPACRIADELATRVVVQAGG